MVCREQIGRIVVTFKDRLLRFGYKLFEKMCKKHNVQIVVYADKQRSEQESKDLETQELQEDLLSIVNVFIARRNGKKARILRQLRREQALKEGDPEQRDED
ncbi:hypothetical protein PC129_g9697 [Phytophthora cactorum]|uniref:Resolvase/invertase-type recombinase catalytic domain-containing protein n=1 Tax=Phytophthora cactorum TaxID=29920 RepID=A0A329SWD6_9STRA|nr:hypothetical protein Pcac1_g26070 [Phytophthora cactorum]KAG2827597.1 hypothetical protein PC111_g8522 [Phytophthora cactorum]KAG2848702.1 hypothetical protein PC112_g595 [Phytophthora cactorum]KAG2863562.1 hypothetical protein PC113_g5325 [Phytophthora cactorum]KAG2921131.1 hypothetical protein PC114_g5788 [Phytophthora cactorum]